MSSALSSNPVCGRADEDSWKTHKDTIHDLYMTQNKTLQDVILEMKRSHNLIATKAQYERHLAKWGFKKNISREIWTQVGIVLKERQDQGKDSVVTIAGKTIPRKKLKRETKRYRYGPESCRTNRVGTQDSPVAHVRAHTPSNESREPEHVPNIDAGSQAEPLEQNDPFALWHSPLPIHPFCSSSVTQNDHLDSTQNGQDSCLSRPSQPLRDHFSLPSISRFESTAQSQQYSDLLLRVGIMTACSGVFTAATVPDILSAMLPPGLLSSSPFGNSTKDLIGTASSKILCIVALYMVSNGLVKPQYEHAKAILEWFQPPRNQSFIKSLIHRNDPASRATFTNIFRYAVIAENVAVLKALPTFTYSHLVNEPHAWFATSDRSQNAHTALDYACIRQNRALYFFLAALGARNSISLPQILQVIESIKLLKHQGSGPLGRIQIDMDLIGAMLKSGITVCQCSDRRGLTSDHISAFVIAFTSDNLELMELLLKSQFRMHQCVAGFDWIKALRGDELSCSRAMLTLLINTGVKVPLEVAIRSQNTKELQHMLEAGAEFNLKDLGVLCDQPNMDFIADAFELYIRHNNPMRQSNPPPLPVLEQLGYNYDNFEPPHSYIPLLSALESEEINSSRSRKIDSLILHILSLPPKISGSYLDRCLYSAVKSGCEYSVKELVRAGACTTHDLVLCANDKGLEMTSTLLNNAWPERTYYEGDHFKHAIEAGDIIAVCKALDAGYDINSREQFVGEPFRGISTLAQAIRCNQSAIISLLLERGADANGRATLDRPRPMYSMISPLAVAIKNQNITLVHQLINIGADVEDESALRAAVAAGHEMVRTLLTARSLKLWRRKPKFALPALQLAIIKKDVLTIRSLLEHGASVHEEWKYSPFPKTNTALLSDEFRAEQTAMETAIIEDRDEDLPVFRLILSAWESLNYPWIGPAWKRTRLLSLAVKHANYHIINLLLAQGADLNATVQGHFIGPPLEIASEMGDINLVQKFLSLGADVNATAPNRFRLPALQYAAKNGFYAIAQLLLNMGAYVDAPGPRPYSWTALELAAQHGRLDMVQLLVNYGAQLHGMGATQFERAKQLATEHKFSAVTELLESLLEKQLASLDHNLQGQWVVSEGDGVVIDGSEQREAGFIPVQIQNSDWPAIDNLDLHSNIPPEDGIEFWNGVTSY